LNERLRSFSEAVGSLGASFLGAEGIGLSFPSRKPSMDDFLDCDSFIRVDRKGAAELSSLLFFGGLAGDILPLDAFPKDLTDSSDVY